MWNPLGLQTARGRRIETFWISGVLSRGMTVKLWLIGGHVWRETKSCDGKWNNMNARLIGEHYLFSLNTWARIHTSTYSRTTQLHTDTGAPFCAATALQNLYFLCLQIVCQQLLWISCRGTNDQWQRCSLCSFRSAISVSLSDFRTHLSDPRF